MLKKKIKPTESQPAPVAPVDPVIDLVIRYDGRTGQVGLTVIGGSIDFEAAYRLLDAARVVVQQQEREALLKASPPSTAPKSASAQDAEEGSE